MAKKRSAGADYDEMAIDLVDGKTAFWFNGTGHGRIFRRPVRRIQMSMDFFHTF